MMKHPIKIWSEWCNGCIHLLHRMHPKTHPHHDIVLSMQALISHDSESREEQELAPICRVGPHTLISCH